MAKFKAYDYRQRVFLPVSLEDQLMPGTLEFAIHTLVETRLDTSVFEQKYRNDETGRTAFHGLFVANATEVWAALLLGPSLVVGISFYLVFSLDSPFTGTLSADLGPFQYVVNLSQPEKPLSPSEPAA